MKEQKLRDLPGVWKLIDERTGAELKKGDRVTTFRGEAGTLTSIVVTRNRVYVALDGDRRGEVEFYPSVIGAKMQFEREGERP